MKQNEYTKTVTGILRPLGISSGVYPRENRIAIYPHTKTGNFSSLNSMLELAKSKKNLLEQALGVEGIKIELYKDKCLHPSKKVFRRLTKEEGKEVKKKSPSRTGGGIDWNRPDSFENETLPDSDLLEK